MNLEKFKTEGRGTIWKPEEKVNNRNKYIEGARWRT
jgi:hypothetical protein